jgi:hypothetical protein
MNGMEELFDGLFIGLATSHSKKDEVKITPVPSATSLLQFQHYNKTKYNETTGTTTATTATTATTGTTTVIAASTSTNTIASNSLLLLEQQHELLASVEWIDTTAGMEKLVSWIHSREGVIVYFDMEWSNLLEIMQIIVHESLSSNNSTRKIIIDLCALLRDVQNEVEVNAEKLDEQLASLFAYCHAVFGSRIENDLAQLSDFRLEDTFTILQMIAQDICEHKSQE